jgi:tetratricopeptide (TPR) repeat protein
MTEASFFDSVVSIIFSIIIGALLTLIGYLWLKREKHNQYYSVTWKPSGSIKPNDLLAERPYEKYYEPRDFDQVLSDSLSAHQNILILGSPLAGKSRAIYELLKKSPESFNILIPRCREVEPDSFHLPIRGWFWKKGVVILDDLQRFIEQRGFEILLREVNRRGFIIVASSRTGNEFIAVRDWMAKQGLHLESVFAHNPVEIPSASEQFGEKVADATHRDWKEIYKRFNGTVGSVFMRLEEMERRFDQATDQEKKILRALQKLYRCGAYEERGSFPVIWIRRIAPMNDAEWLHSTEILQQKEFFRIRKDTIQIEPVYVEDIVKAFPECPILDLIPQVSRAFENEPVVLLKIGDRVADYGEYDLDIAQFMKCAITLYSRVVKHHGDATDSFRYARTQNNLGIAYWKLSMVEEKAENCRKAIGAYGEALKVYTLDRFPVDYAMTQNNLGVAYRKLSMVEEKAENCRRAIGAYGEALKVYTLDRFPVDYAMTQNNLGVAYRNLSEMEEKAENCRRAIGAYEVALKVHTLDRFPVQYAATQNNLGNAYQTLGEVEEKAENCRRAIGACEEVLKVYTLDRFPMDYATTQNNLGNAYQTLGEVEEKAENCRRAIGAYVEALKVHTLARFPMDYAMIQYNLGVTYRKLSMVEEKAENCRRAIEAYGEALKVYTADLFPMQYAMVKACMDNIQK